MERVKSRRAQYAEMTRAAVLEGARALFAERGFEGTSVDDIAQASQVSKGAVYHHFADKREVFAQLFGDAQEEAMAAVVAAADAVDSDWERALTASRTFLRCYVKDEQARAIVRQAPTVLDHDRICQIDEKAALPFIRDTLHRLDAAGLLHAVPIAPTARIFRSILVEATLQIAESDDPAEAYEQADTVIVALVSGLLRPPTQ